jgi:hypothetical protein
VVNLQLLILFIVVLSKTTKLSVQILVATFEVAIRRRPYRGEW